MKKTLFALVMTCLGLMSCGSQKKEEAPQAEEPAQPKVLVLYYSQNGTTQALAEEIQKQLGADIEAIECDVPYDGTYNETIQRAQDEIADNEMPAVKPLSANVGNYDVIFLGYPVWFNSYALPIGGLLRSQSFDGLKIVTFCTFGSGGLQSSTAKLKEQLPESEIIEGFGIRTARIDAVKPEVERFLIEKGFKKGDVEALPAFMEHHPVTDEEKAIFSQACDDYEYPLGKPVSVAVRETSTSTDYEFTVMGHDGTINVYVTQGKEEGAQPEFTHVVR